MFIFTKKHVNIQYRNMWFAFLCPKKLPRGNQSVCDTAIAPRLTFYTIYSLFSTHFKLAYAKELFLNLLM